MSVRGHSHLTNFCLVESFALRVLCVLFRPQYASDRDRLIASESFQQNWLRTIYVTFLFYNHGHFTQ